MTSGLCSPSAPRDSSRWLSRQKRMFFSRSASLRKELLFTTGSLPRCFFLFVQIARDRIGFFPCTLGMCFYSMFKEFFPSQLSFFLSQKSSCRLLP